MIQFIHTVEPVLDTVKFFDLSICATVFYPTNGEFWSLDEVSTKNKIGYPLYSKSERTEIERDERIKKYRARGFLINDEVTLPNGMKWTGGNTLQ